MGILNILWGIRKSGTKMTVKRPAPWSPANIRKVDPAKGYNPRHTHIKVKLPK